jgi:hypothetical protein
MKFIFKKLIKFFENFKSKQFDFTKKKYLNRTPQQIYLD